MHGGCRAPSRHAGAGALASDGSRNCRHSRGRSVMSQSYQEEVARMRMERKQAEAADQYNQLVDQYNQAVEARDEESLQILSKGGDRTDYDYWDSQVEEAERGLAPYFRAQQQQQQNSHDAQWNYLNRDF